MSRLTSSAMIASNKRYGLLLVYFFIVCSAAWAICVVLSSPVRAASPLTISSISPASGSIDGGDTVTITGTGFTGGIRVFIDGSEVMGANVLDDSTAVFVMPAATYVHIASLEIIDTLDQTANLSSGYSYKLASAPTIQSVTPNAGSMDGGDTIMIRGSAFADAGEGVLGIASGDRHGCATYLNSQIYCWGYNYQGQLGDSTKVDTTTPVAVDTSGVLAGKSIRAMATGTTHTCAIASDDQVYCWGYNLQGQLGTNSTTSTSVPVPVYTGGALAGKTVRAIAAGGNSTCALTTDDQLYCWGDNSYGQLGNNSKTRSLVPKQIYMSGVLNGKTIRSVTLSVYNACAIASDNNAYCWGDNGQGQLGNNSITGSSAPVAVYTAGALAGKTVKQVSAAGAHTCAIASDDNAYCWGGNTSGNLGSNVATRSTVPVAVDTSGALAGKTVKKISTAYISGCAIASDDQVYCWGGNNYGQLGDGTLTTSKTPKLVDTSAFGGLSFDTVSLGTGFACAITKNSKIYCWGRNADGQLGTGDEIDTTTPLALINPNIAPDVTFGAQPVQSASFVSSDELSVVTAAHAQGTVDVSVMNYDGQSYTASSAYTYIGPPGITSVVPNSGYISGGNQITVYGSGFAADNTVAVNGIDATNVNVVSDTVITATVPASIKPGAVNVVVRDSYGQVTTLTNGYTYVLEDPQLTSVTPDIGRDTGGTTVTISGTGFIADPDGGTWYRVSFNGNAATAVTYVDQNTLTARTPPGVIGAVDVTVSSNYTNDVTLTKGFTYIGSNFAFTSTALSMATDEIGHMIITLRDTNGNATPAPSDVAIGLTSESSTGQFAINLSEDEATRWTYDSVTLPAGQSSVDLWYRDTTVGAPYITAQVGSDITFSQRATIVSPYRFEVTGITSPITQGEPSSLTLRVVDRNGGQRTDYTGTIHFTSSDPAAHLPSDYTMKASDYGIKTFTNGVTMGSVGTYCVTATDTVEATTTGQQCGISVTAANQGVISKLAITTPAQHVVVGHYSAPITVQTQDSTGTTIPVSGDTSIYFYSSVVSGAFSSDGENWSSTQPFIATIPAGSSSVNIHYKDDTANTATISARDLPGDTASVDQGWSNVSQSITTGLSPPTKLNISGPQVVIAGQTASYTVELRDSSDRPVSSDSDITIRVDGSTATTRFYLSNDPLTPLTGPVEFVIPAGQTSTMIAMSDTTLSTSGNPTTLAFTDGRPLTEVVRIDDASFDVQVVDALPSALLIEPSSATVEVNKVLALTIKLIDDNGQPIDAALSTVVSLANGGGGEFSLSDAPFTPTSSVTFNSGESSKTIYYRNQAVGSRVITATSSGLDPSSATINTTAGAVAGFGITPSSAEVSRDTPSPVYTINAYDIYGNVAAASADTTIYLSSTSVDTAFATQPNGDWSIQTVTLLAGQTSVQFYARDTAFHGSPITLTASADGISSATTTMTIISEALASMTFTTAPQTILAGNTSGAITINLMTADGSPAYQDGSSVLELSVTGGKLVANSTDTIDSLGITTLAIPSGQASATFYYVGTTAGTFTISANMRDASSIKTAQPITVTSAPETGPPQLQFVSAPASAPAGVPSGAIYIGVADQYGNPITTDSDIAIGLATSCTTGSFSSDQAVWQPISSATLSAGEESVGVYYKDLAAGSCELTISAPGFADVERTITITTTSTPTPTSLVMTTSSVNPTAGDDVVITVSLRDKFGNITPATTNTTVYMSSDASGATFSESPLTFPVGISTQSVHFVNTTVGKINIFARDQIGGEVAGTLSDAQLSLTYAEGSSDKIAILGPTTAQAGEVVTYTIELQNQNDAVITAASNTVVTLSTSASGTFTNESEQAISQVTIPAGQSTAVVNYTQAAAGSALLSAQASGLDSGYKAVSFTSASTTMAIKFINAAHIGQRAQEIAEEGPYQVGLYDLFGNLTTNSDPITLYISTSGAGKLSSQSIVIPAGQSVVDFTYTSNSIESYQITVSDSDSGVSGELGSITQSGEVVANKPRNFIFSPSSIDLERGDTSGKITVQLVDANGEPAKAVSSGQDIWLVSDTGDGRFSTVKSASSYQSSLTLHISSGSSTASFYYRNATGNPSVDQTVHGSTTFLDGTLLRDLNVNLSYGQPVALTYTTSRPEIPADQPSPALSVQRQNQFGIGVPVEEDTLVHLRSTAAQTGVFGATKTDWGVSSVTIKRGQSSADFYYRDSQQGTPTITAADSLPLAPDIGLTNATQLAIISAPTGVQRQIDNFLVTNISDPHQAGTPSSVVVIARDAAGYIVDDYTGTISFGSDDPNAILPANYTFRASDRGVKTFQNAVAFTAEGEKTVTVTDSGGHSGAQESITVLSSSNQPATSLSFTWPDAPLTVAPDTISPYITLQLLDAAGNPTIAPAGGQQITVTTNTANGQFALAEGGPWRSSLDLTIPAGIGYANIYYRDSEVGGAVLSATAVGTNAITPASFEVLIHDVRVDGESVLWSRNAFGAYERSHYLFSAKPDGSIRSKAEFSYRSVDLANSQPVDTLWRSQWRQGVKLLDTNTGLRDSSFSDTRDNIATTAGSTSYYSVAEATAHSFDDAYSVASKQIETPVSPWRSTVAIDTKPSGVSVEATFISHSTPASPAAVTAYLLRADASSAINSLATFGAVDPGSGYSFDVAANTLEDAKSYRVLIVSYDQNGEITSQALSDVFTKYSEATTNPVEPELPAGNIGGSPTELTTGNNNPPDAVETGEDIPVAPDDTSNQPGAVSDEPPQSPLKAQHVMLTAVSTSSAAVIVVLLLRESYKEWARIRRMRAILKREARLAADKDTFLSLSSHYLRTPLTILEAVAQSVPGLKDNLGVLVASMRNKANTILASSGDAKLAEITDPDIARATRSAYSSPFFWLPIILSVALTGAVMALIAAASYATLDTVTVDAVIIGIAILLAVFFAGRVIYINREIGRMDALFKRHRQQLFDAKNSFITETQAALDQDLSTVRQLLATSEIPTAYQTPLQEGLAGLDDLITKLRLAARIDGVVANPQRFSMKHLAESALSYYRPSIAAKKLRVITRGQTDLAVNQDEQLLGYVTSTLLDNAIKYSDSSSTIEVAAETSGKENIISISNHTSRDDVPTEGIFEAFNRAETHDDLATNGTGLSLYLDKLIMEHIGGDISAKASGRGFTVRISFPSL